MTLRSDKIGEFLSASAARIRDALSKSNGSAVHVCVVAFNDAELRLAATASSDLLRKMLPDLATEIGEGA